MHQLRDNQWEWKYFSYNFNFDSARISLIIVYKPSQKNGIMC